MTSGNIAVFDHDALRHIDYVSEFHKIFGLNTDPAEASARISKTPSPRKQSGDFDTEEVLERQNVDPQDRSDGGGKDGRGAAKRKSTFWSFPSTAREKSPSGRSATRTWPLSPNFCES